MRFSDSRQSLHPYTYRVFRGKTRRLEYSLRLNRATRNSYRQRHF